MIFFSIFYKFCGFSPKTLGTIIERLKMVPIKATSNSFFWVSNWSNLYLEGNNKHFLNDYHRSLFVLPVLIANTNIHAASFFCQNRCEFGLSWPHGGVSGRRIITTFGVFKRKGKERPATRRNSALIHEKTQDNLLKFWKIFISHTKMPRLRKSVYLGG